MIEIPVEFHANGARDGSWRNRLDGAVPREVDAKHVLIVGCGSVGSFLASELVRAGVSKFTLIDPDIVEWPNLTRTVYGHADVGRQKVVALNDHLKSVFPDVEVRAVAASLKRGEEQLLRTVLADVDIVISAVDDPAASGMLDRFCYALNKPAVFVGLYRGAKGGEIIVVAPGTTPCYHCTTGGVRRIASESGLEHVDRPRDYGTSRLVAEVALGSDIHFVCCAAAKIVLSLLSDSTAEGSLPEFMGSQLRQASNFIILGMEPRYFLFPSTHARALGQHAFQSVWAGGQSDPECEVCGLQENREPL